MSIATTKNDRIKRLEALYPYLESLNLEALLIEDPVDLFYLTGCLLSCGKLWIQKERSCLIVDSRYFEICKKQSPCPVKALEEEPLIPLFKEIQGKNLGFDSTKMTFSRYLALKEESKKAFSLIAVLNPLKTFRGIKDQAEVALLKAAAQENVRGFEYVKTLLVEGVKEQEVANALQIFWLQRGAEGASFDPIIAFGPNSANPHHKSGETALKLGDIVLIDIGVNVKHVQSDLTRVLFFGEPKDRQLQEIYHIVQEAKERSQFLCRPGKTVKELDVAARGYIKNQGFGEFFKHGLGHGVGLEIHEWPRVSSQGEDTEVTLEPGMVITIEPGIYLPGVGGVRLEDTLLITPSGFEILTKSS